MVLEPLAVLEPSPQMLSELSDYRGLRCQMKYDWKGHERSKDVVVSSRHYVAV